MNTPLPTILDRITSPTRLYWGEVGIRLIDLVRGCDLFLKSSVNLIPKFLGLLVCRMLSISWDFHKCLRNKKKLFRPVSTGATVIARIICFLLLLLWGLFLGTLCTLFPDILRSRGSSFAMPNFVKGFAIRIRALVGIVRTWKPIPPVEGKRASSSESSDDMLSLRHPNCKAGIDGDICVCYSLATRSKKILMTLVTSGW